MATPANLTSVQTFEAQVAGPGGATRVVFVTGLARWGLAVDANFDDDARQVRLEFDVEVSVPGPPMPVSTQVLLLSVGFQVTILAA